MGVGARQRIERPGDEIDPLGERGIALGQLEPGAHAAVLEARIDGHEDRALLDLPGVGEPWRREDEADPDPRLELLALVIILVAAEPAHLDRVQPSGLRDQRIRPVSSSIG
jgi:hypothetical protein